VTYVRGNSRDYLARLQHQKAIAAAELEAEERRLQAIRGAEMELARINHKRRVVADQIKDALNPAKKQLPPPIHGGRQGLEEATREMRQHEYKTGVMARKRKTAA
jgi:hypothetical protein